MNKTMTKHRILMKLFTSMFYISSFTFGGGFVIATFMKKKFADQLHWIDEEEMLDMIALAQSSPGAIAVNTAVLVGWQIRGFAGMLSAVMGTILPPVIILSIISSFYEAFASNLLATVFLRGMQAGVAAVILDVVCELAGNVLRERSWLYTSIMLVAFCLTFVLKVNVILVIVAVFFVGFLSALAKERKA